MRFVYVVFIWVSALCVSASQQTRVQKAQWDNLEQNFKLLLQQLKKQPVTMRNYEMLCQRKGIPDEIIDEITESLPQQRVDWHEILLMSLPDHAWKMYKDGTRIFSVQEAYKHLQLANQKRSPLQWQVDRLWIWIAQYVVNHCQKQTLNMEKLKQDLQNILRITPDEYRESMSEGVTQILQKMESQMVQRAIVAAAKGHVGDASWFEVYSRWGDFISIVSGSTSVKQPVDPWIVETFDKAKFTMLKDEKIAKLWDNLQGVSGGFDNVVRSIVGEIEAISREELDSALYQKNMNSFIRGFYQEFQTRVQKAPLGIAAWYYDTLSSDLRNQWANGPHYYPAACQQWRGDKESLATLYVGGVQLAVLRGLREIEAKNTQRSQKVDEVKRLIDAWAQRFQEVPKVIDAIQPVESALEDVVDNGSAWPILAQLTQENMSSSSYKELIKQFPLAVVKKSKSSWDSVRKIKKACEVPWGRKGREAHDGANGHGDGGGTDKLVYDLIAHGQSGQGKEKVDVMGDPNKALEVGLKQFFGAAFG